MVAKAESPPVSVDLCNTEEQSWLLTASWGDQHQDIEKASISSHCHLAQKLPALQHESRRQDILAHTVMPNVYHRLCP